jgi:hypothetical protein
MIKKIIKMIIKYWFQMFILILGIISIWIWIKAPCNLWKYLGSVPVRCIDYYAK